MTATTRTIVRTALAIALVLSAAGLVACKRATSKSAVSTLPAAEQPAPGTSGQSAGATSGAVGGSGAAKSAGQGQGSSAVTNTETSNSGSGTKTGSGSSAVKPAPITKPTAVQGMKIKILFWNDTAAKALSGCEIVLGSSSFKPNTSGKSAQGVVGPAQFNKKLELVVYPNGRGGKKFVVPFTVTPDMVPNSEQDAIHVAVSDSSVRVLGNAVFNFDQTFPR